ncbi:MAG: Uma2 family endonuclease [Myxococcales bacterium]|nr:Uma2 family endonuclease [Myxococcales bacterium]
MGEPRLPMDPATYLAFEREAKDKHELWGGEVYAMSGASLAHNCIVANLVRRLGERLDGTPCRALPSDMRVHIPAREAYVYPDVTVICGPPELESNDVLLNPRTIIEVLSPSTAAFDRTDKFAGYRSIQSVQEILFVSQSAAQVECYVRQASGSWLMSEYGSEDNIPLEMLTSPLPVAQIYAGVELG